MRRAMICITMMLLMVQVWPVVFGHRPGAASAAISIPIPPRPVAAVATAKLVPVSASTIASGTGAMRSCYRQYQAAFAMCPSGDKACHFKAADKWDLCEATGFWPN